MAGFEGALVPVTTTPSSILAVRESVVSACDVPQAPMIADSDNDNNVFNSNIKFFISLTGVWNVSGGSSVD